MQTRVVETRGCMTRVTRWVTRGWGDAEVDDNERALVRTVRELWRV